MLTATQVILIQYVLKVAYTSALIYLAIIAFGWMLDFCKCVKIIVCGIAKDLKPCLPAIAVIAFVLLIIVALFKLAAFLIGIFGVFFGLIIFLIIIG